MCGICGQFNFQDNYPVDHASIKKMTDSMIHRGPDDEGYFIDESIGLGFRRLSIIDIAGGHQPMSDAEGTLWIVFNGEIYNLGELQKELAAQGHIFQTRSDTEVIIHGYQEWGINVLNHLNGMFGLAIWDAKKQQLMLARDRMGIKMLYYKIDAGKLYFGSEIKAIQRVQHNTPVVNPTALNLFLRYRYTPSPLTIFDGIQKLQPGTRLIFKKNKNPKIERWWNFKPAPLKNSISPEQAQENLLELYQASVKRHLTSDVPVGLLLSGGVDSGLLLALMNQNGNSWKTFSIGYGQDFKDDELSDAADTAKIFHSHHHSLKIDQKTFEATLPNIISHLEEPIASSSIVPMYHVCQLAQQKVKVALIGQGPDELFGGYKRHLGVAYGNYWRELPRWLHQPLSSILKSMPRNETIQRGLYALNVTNRMKRYQQVLSIMPACVVDSLFQKDILPSQAGDAILDCWSDLESLMTDTDELGGLQFLEIRSTLPDELLMYADKLSMAHSLEVRVPYLDYEIVQYVEQLPAHFKIKHFSRKWLHRKVCNSYLPSEILKRKKRGFAVNVVDDWFRKTLTDKLKNLLLDPASLMYQYLQPHVVKNFLFEHQLGKHDYHKILFSLVVFEEWLRSTSQ